MITNLTEKQVSLLNTMWSLDSMEDLLGWMATLSEEDLKQSLALQELLIINSIDETIEYMDAEDFQEAASVISRIKHTLH
jgi:bifunctional N-acetylglucosamine-1-phosphate-uridyltransferase/glucosamine-1-phosphate-acetyltransferase GlmU-like protein